MIIGTLLIRDEADIIENNIEHHLSHGVDMLIITDNGSVDGTRDLISRYGNVVKIIDEPTHDYRQSDWVTRMAHMACDYDPDWIFHADADEFWYEVHNVLKIPDCGIVRVGKFYEHYPSEGLEYGRLDFNDMPYYHIVKSSGKIIHKPSRSIVIQQGNHGATSEFAVCETELVFIHHYAVRSYAQFERKIINGGRSYEVYPGDPNHGSHWRKQYKQWQEGRLPEVYDGLLFKDVMNDEELHVAKLGL